MGSPYSVVIVERGINEQAPKVEFDTIMNYNPLSLFNKIRNCQTLADLYYSVTSVHVDHHTYHEVNRAQTLVNVQEQQAC